MQLSASHVARISFSFFVIVMLMTKYFVNSSVQISIFGLLIWSRIRVECLVRVLRLVQGDERLGVQIHLIHHVTRRVVVVI